MVVAAAGNEHGAVTRAGELPRRVGVARAEPRRLQVQLLELGAGVAIATVGGDPRLLGNWGMALGDDGLLTLGNAGTTDPRGGIYA